MYISKETNMLILAIRISSQLWTHVKRTKEYQTMVSFLILIKEEFRD